MNALLHIAYLQCRLCPALISSSNTPQQRSYAKVPLDANWTKVHFGSFTTNCQLWLQTASKAMKGKDPASLVWKTPEGIDIKPIYTTDDVTDLKKELPGTASCLTFWKRHNSLLVSLHARTIPDNVRATSVDYPSVQRFLNCGGVERLLQGEYQGGSARSQRCFRLADASWVRYISHEPMY